VRDHKRRLERNQQNTAVPRAAPCVYPPFTSTRKSRALADHDSSRDRSSAPAAFEPELEALRTHPRQSSARPARTTLSGGLRSCSVAHPGRRRSAARLPRCARTSGIRSWRPAALGGRAPAAGLLRRTVSADLGVPRAKTPAASLSHSGVNAAASTCRRRRRFWRRSASPCYGLAHRHTAAVLRRPREARRSRRAERDGRGGSARIRRCRTGSSRAAGPRSSDGPRTRASTTSEPLIELALRRRGGAEKRPRPGRYRPGSSLCLSPS